MKQEVDALVGVLTHKMIIGEHWMQSPGVIRNAGMLFLSASRLPVLRGLILHHAHMLARAVKVIHNEKAYRLRLIIPSLRVKNYHLKILALAEMKTLALYWLYKSNKFYNRLVHQLAETLGADGFQVGAFVSLKGTPGLGKHKDTVHIFVFQHIGKSRWRIYDPLGRLVKDIILEPGDIAYVPKGFYHQVERMTEEECHVSVGLFYKTRYRELLALYTNPVLQVALAPSERNLFGQPLREAIESHLLHPIQTTAVP